MSVLSPVDDHYYLDLWIGIIVLALNRVADGAFTPFYCFHGRDALSLSRGPTHTLVGTLTGLPDTQRALHVFNLGPS